MAALAGWIIIRLLMVSIGNIMMTEELQADMAIADVSSMVGGRLHNLNCALRNSWYIAHVTT